MKIYQTDIIHNRYTVTVKVEADNIVKARQEIARTLQTDQLRPFFIVWDGNGQPVETEEQPDHDLYNRYLHEVLHNLSLSENDNQNMTLEQARYYRGLIVGAVSALLGTGKSWEQAMSLIKANLPDNPVDLEKITPNTWLHYLV